ncbi:TPM domain-containing protein [Aquibium oceanicum]|uniref:TPM domain-containing protein n=1 Tax=Aquibium oceanicum TaxID=1670800 RepID=A0A1L3SKY0_9HYPH|nr:TPM domain-containing protein [Aquibium oceanicum]APH70031.1 hypothetical protein BSQ44_00515 [Aquibium oceanicum]
MTSGLSPEDRQRVAEAIRIAEAKTSGEIYCVLARRSDDYFFASALMLTLGMLATSLVAALAAHWLWVEVAPVSLVLAQAGAFASALLVLRVVPDLRVHLVPPRLRYRRAHDNAARQFLAHNVHATQARTGVLIFVSLAERYAEVVADSGIDDKVDQSTWNDIVARLVEDARGDRLGEGFANAVESVGALLAEHFPPGATNPNELDDHIVEI